jgi:hypothetical protein
MCVIAPSLFWLLFSYHITAFMLLYYSWIKIEVVRLYGCDNCNFIADIRQHYFRHKKNS